MSTAEMFQLWLIKEIGVPVVIIAAIILCIAAYVIIGVTIEFVREKIKARRPCRNLVCPVRPQFPERPAPCPHCGVPTVRGWGEGVGYKENGCLLGRRYYIEHGDPVCQLGSKRLRVFPITNHEVACFEYWSNDQTQFREERSQTGAPCWRSAITGE